MQKCYFASAAPRIEVRGDLLFVIPECDRIEIALTPHTMAEFIAKAGKALAEFDQRVTADVVDFPGH
jgi:hypothetical protein